MSWHQIQKIFPGLLNICAKFEEIPSTSKDAIGRQTCGASGACGPFRENSSHMQMLNTVEPLLSDPLRRITIRSDNRNAKITSLSGVGRVSLRLDN